MGKGPGRAARASWRIRRVVSREVRLPGYPGNLAVGRATGRFCRGSSGSPIALLWRSGTRASRPEPGSCGVTRQATGNVRQEHATLRPAPGDGCARLAEAACGAGQ